MLRYRTGADLLDFHGEFSGWDRVLKIYFEVVIPAQVQLGERVLAPSEVDALAARMHLALCSMKKRNVIVRRVAWPPLPESDRTRILSEFQRWMEERGYRVAIDRASERISIKHKRLRLFRRKPSENEILDLGAWVARAFHALLDTELDQVVLFISEGARPTSGWLAQVD
jgi:hypothetical protein